MAQYTIRNVPNTVDRELRDLARRRGVSLNEATIDVIKRGLGVSGEPIEYHDLDDLIGSWKDDDRFDAAIAEQDTVEPDLWR